MPDDELSVPVTAASDVALQALLTGGIGFVPFIGTPMAQIIGTGLDMAARRKDEAFWAAVVAELRAHGAKIQEIQTDRFVAATWRILPAAREAADDVYLDALAVALGKSGDWSLDLPADRERFVGYLLRFNQLHIRILRFFQDPIEWMRERDITTPGSGPLNFEDLLVMMAFDESWRLNIRWALSELQEAGLVMDLAPGVGPSQSLTDSFLVSGLLDEGKAFLNYIDSATTKEAPEVSSSS
ncbi:MAG: hypothetical protein HIU88_05690 [Acidobacteria bacterium]|nr:hypothetical protein [Acidobacteriota bacterium]